MQNTPKFLFFFWFPSIQKKNGTEGFLLVFSMEPRQSCSVIVSWEVGAGRKKKIKQIGGVNLQQETNNLHTHMCNQLSFFQRSTKGIEHSHRLSGVVLRCLLLAALPANDNKADSVKGVVEMSEEMQDHAENIRAPLRGCCSCESG